VAVADLVKSTLGPKGMDKILQSVGRGQEIVVTNDGATILKSVYVDNPAARVLVGAFLLLLLLLLLLFACGFLRCGWCRLCGGRVRFWAAAARPPTNTTHNPFSFHPFPHNKQTLTVFTTQRADISRVQDDEVGDGTTSVVVLAGELLREAEALVGAKVRFSGVRRRNRVRKNAAKTHIRPPGSCTNPQPQPRRKQMSTTKQTNKRKPHDRRSIGPPDHGDRGLPRGSAGRGSGADVGRVRPRRGRGRAQAAPVSLFVLCFVLVASLLSLFCPQSALTQERNAKTHKQSKTN